MDDIIFVEKKDFILTVAINRPQRGNAVNVAALLLLQETLNNPGKETRAVVL